MCAGFFLGGEEARTFHHHVDAQFTPRQLGRIALSQHTNFVTIDDDVVALHRDSAGKFAMRRVVARQVGIGFHRAQVVDRHDLDIVFLVALVVGTEDIAADAAVTVDGDFDGHFYRFLRALVVETTRRSAQWRRQGFYRNAPFHPSLNAT